MNPISRIGLGLSLLLFSFSTWGQDYKKLDSLLRVYESLPDDTTKVIHLNRLFKFYMYNNPDKSKAYIDAQYELATKLPYEKGIGISYQNYADYFNRTGRKDTTTILLKKALEIYEKIGWLEGQGHVRFSLANKAIFEPGGYDKKLEMLESDIEFYKSINDSVMLGRAYLGQANAQMGKGNYKIALEKNLRSLYILEHRATDLQVAEAYRFLGIIECELQNGEQAIQYCRKALEIYEAHEAQTLVGRVLNTLGITYDYMNDFENADSAYERAYAIARKQKDPYEQMLVLINHSRSYEKREEYTKAMVKLNAYLELDKALDIKSMSSLGYLGMGSALVYSGKPREAKAYLDTALVFAKRESVKERIMLSYQHRAMANEKLNDFESAYRDHQMYTLYKDSIFDDSKSQQIEEMRTIFDTQKKEEQIARQETEIALLEEKEKVSALQKGLLGSGLGLSLLVFGFGFYGIRQKMKRTRLEQEKVAAELDFKKKELTTQTLHLARKNETLEKLKQKAQELKSSANSTTGYQQLITSINIDLHDDSYWENFARYFKEVHKDFNSNAAKKCPELTPNELRLMALLRMNLSSKEIASILNISIPGIKKARQRLRRKMNLSTRDSLEKAILDL